MSWDASPSFCLFLYSPSFSPTSMSNVTIYICLIIHILDVTIFTLVWFPESSDDFLFRFILNIHNLDDLCLRDRLFLDLCLWFENFLDLESLALSSDAIIWSLLHFIPFSSLSYDYLCSHHYHLLLLLSFSVWFWRRFVGWWPQRLFLFWGIDSVSVTTPRPLIIDSSYY